MQISSLLSHLVCCLALAVHWQRVEAAAGADNNIANNSKNNNNGADKLIILTINVPKLRVHRAHLSLCDSRLHIIRETKLHETPVTVFNVSANRVATHPNLENSPPIKSRLLVPNRRLECESSGEVLRILSLQDLTYYETGTPTDETFDAGNYTTLSFNEMTCKARLAQLKNSTRTLDDGDGDPKVSHKVSWAEYLQVCEDMMTVKRNLLQGLIRECQGSQNCTVPSVVVSQPDQEQQRHCAVLDRLGLSQRMELAYQCLPGGGQSRFSTRTVTHQDLSNRVACPAGRLLYLASAVLSPRVNASQCSGSNSAKSCDPTTNGLLSSSSQSEDSPSPSWLQTFLSQSENWAKFKFEDLGGPRDDESRQEGDVNFSDLRAARRKRAVPTTEQVNWPACSILVRTIETCHGRPDCSLSLDSLIGDTHNECNLRASRKIYGPHRLSFNYSCLESSKWANWPAASDSVHYALTLTTNGRLIQSESIVNEHDHAGREVLVITELGSKTLSEWLHETAPTGRLPFAALSSYSSPVLGRSINQLSYQSVIMLCCSIFQLLPLLQNNKIQIKSNQL